MEVKYRKEIYLLLVSVALILVWAGYMENPLISSLLWLGLGMALIPLITIIRAWYGIKITRILPKDRIYSGDNLMVVIEVENRFFAPLLWTKVIDYCPMKYVLKHNSKGDSSDTAHFITKGGKLTSYILEDVPRGKLRWTKFKLFRTDLLGLVEVSKSADQSEEIIVYPKYVNIPLDQLLNKYDENQGVSKLFKGNDYSQISGVREYQRGDKLSLINWKVSARKNSLMCKEFFPLLNQEAHILLDCSRENYLGNYNSDFELAVSVAASLTSSLAKYENGLCLKLNNKQKDVIHFKSKAYFINESMKKLALVESDGDKSLDTVLNQQYFNDNRGVTLFVVTNKISEKVLNKIFIGSGKAKVRVYLIGDSQGDKFQKYGFVQQVKSLGDLVVTKGLRGVSNG